MKAPVYLIVPSTGVGGMEKRLVEIWLRLARKHDNLYLVLSEGTLTALQARPDLPGLEALAARVVVYPLVSPKYLTMMRALIRVTRKLQRGSTVHYLLQAPPLIDRLLGHRMIVSWVGNYVPRAWSGPNALKGWLASRLAFHSAHRIDVLNPDVALALAEMPGLKSKLSLTAGGSFADFEHFRPADHKRDEVVFLGRTEAGKNALAFAQAIPAIAQRLAAHGRGVRFLIYGAPAGQEPEIQALLTSADYAGIAVERGQTADSATVLASAKVFVSIQQNSNYPSKALVEAMGSGCVPVINASGESRRMADERLAKFIPEKFTTRELADAVCELLLLDEGVLAQRAAAVREDAMRRFRIERQLDYFAELWGLANSQATGD